MNDHKWKWVKEYSKIGKVNQVSFSTIKDGIENLNDNIFIANDSQLS